ncbi:hypothetical protein [Leptospira interrogans]|uniref:hypothetical protein n=1 Tax=Leptospira interrogans TaxID=173 RepID=UPI00036550C8|nr:hypothetical protein [Leptospira interrogans]
MVLCNKIAEGIDTRNIGESVVLSFPMRSIKERCAEFSNAIHRKRCAEFNFDSKIFLNL